MKSEIQINDKAGSCRIEIEGTIGVPEEWQFDDPADRVATYERFRDAVRRIAEIEAPEVVVEIRSTGGDVNDALLIHDALRSLGARITTRCYGYTASAATIIAQAASEGRREISANALYLIHDSVCAAEGNASEPGGEDRPAPPDRRPHRRGLCRPFGASGGGIRGADGREQRQRPLALARGGGGGGTGRPRDRRRAARRADAGAEPLAGMGTAARRTGTAPGRSDGRGRNALPADRNVLHAVPDDGPRRRAAAEAMRRRFRATETLPCEDPPYGDAVQSANARAYAEDAKCFRG